MHWGILRDLAFGAGIITFMAATLAAGIYLDKRRR
jgi:hypothetical protein